MSEKVFKRFMVFGYDMYESPGGLNDCAGDFDELKDAVSFCKSGTFDYYDIFDRLKGVEIEWK